MRAGGLVRVAVIGALIATGCDSSEGGGAGGAAGTASGGAAGSSSAGAGGAAGAAAGTAGGAGAAGASAGGASAGGAAGTSTGGAAGASAGGAAGSDPGCDGRSGGAIVTFQITTESLSVWVTDSSFVDEALSQLTGAPPRIPVFEDLIAGADCDPQWTWHPDPAKVQFADATIEVCDGRPSDIENDQTYWLGTVDSYCPWSATATAVDDRRQ
jgi:hypothetical protein